LRRTFLHCHCAILHLIAADPHRDETLLHFWNGRKRLVDFRAKPPPAFPSSCARSSTAKPVPGLFSPTSGRVTCTWAASRPTLQRAAQPGALFPLSALLLSSSGIPDPRPTQPARNPRTGHALTMEKRSLPSVVALGHGNSALRVAEDSGEDPVQCFSPVLRKETRVRHGRTDAGSPAVDSVCHNSLPGTAEKATASRKATDLAAVPRGKPRVRALLCPRGSRAQEPAHPHPAPAPWGAEAPAPFPAPRGSTRPTPAWCSDPRR